MRYAFSLLLALSSVSLAQSRPQLTWSGYVTGSATLYIQGDRVDVQGRQTGAVDRPTSNFSSSLPAVRQTVNMTVRRGRGTPEIVEQPNPGNEYSTVVQLNAPTSRPEFYVIDFFWDPYARQSSNRGYRDDRMRDERTNDDWWRDDRNNNGYSRSRETYSRTREYGTRSRTVDDGPGELRWSGNVDGQVLIEVRGRRAATRVLRGQPVTNEQIDFTAPLPRAGNTVRLEDVNGRGRVEIVDQPTEANGYAAMVRITDAQAGSGYYTFRLAWDSGAGSYYDRRDNERGGNVLAPSSDSAYTPRNDGLSSVHWTGRVDGRARITLQDNRAVATVVNGRPVAGMNTDFSGNIPLASARNPEIRKIAGRGDVRLVQLPSPANGGALAFEINDTAGGDDFYEIEITWR